MEANSEEVMEVLVKQTVEEKDAETDSETSEISVNQVVAVQQNLQTVAATAVVANEIQVTAVQEENIWAHLPFSAILLGLETLEMQSRQKT
jgi:hypothetical protein